MGWHARSGATPSSRSGSSGSGKYRTLVKRTYRVCVRTVGIVALCLGALVMVAALRLMEGPVDLDFLKARLIAAADVPGNETKPEVDRISLEWGGVSQPMRLLFTGL